MANEKRRFGMSSQPANGQELAGVEEALDRDVSELGRRILGHGRFETRIVVTWGNAAVRTIELGEELGADLIVSGTHQVHGVRRLWHSSFSRTLLHDSPTNILLVPSLGASLTAADTIEYHRVLVSTDLSELGNRAIPAALAAVDPGGTLQIVHVIPPGPVSNPLDADSVEMGKVLKRKHEDEKRRLETELRALVPVSPQSATVAVEVALVESATPPEAIVQAAERFGAQMVCLASHGKSGIAWCEYPSLEMGLSLSDGCRPQSTGPSGRHALPGCGPHPIPRPVRRRCPNWTERR
jgi:nucleotide-binding universal stress UspA family protein